jgi:cytochrome c oxidase assembly factor CtaG
MLPPFGWHAVLTRWEFSPVVTGVAVTAGALYLWGAWRVARRHPARPWAWWRTALFLGGLAVVVLATQSGIGSYDDVLFWDHMVQHLLLIMVAPPLLVLGQPVTLLLHASRNPLHTWAKRAIRSRVASFVTWPPFGLAAYTATIVGTHLTSLPQDVLRNPALHNAEHVLYLLVGYLFFLPLLGREPIRWRVSYPGRLLILAVAMPVDTFTGLVLGYAGAAYSPLPGTVRPPGAPGPVEDTHWAGAVMWIGGDAIMFAFMMLAVWMWSRDTRGGGLGSGWLEAARRSSFEDLLAAGVPGQPARPQGQQAAAAPGEHAGEPGNRAAAPRARAGAHPARGIDDDEHLAAYNAYLARLNGSEPGRNHTGHG